jgi:hypothetical protein
MREKKEWIRAGEEEKSTNKQHKDTQKTTKNRFWTYLFSSLTICSSRSWLSFSPPISHKFALDFYLFSSLTICSNRSWLSFSPPSSHKFSFLKNQQVDQAAQSKFKHTKINVI